MEAMSLPPCLVCGNTSWEPHLEVLLRCPACGFVTARLDQSLNTRDLYTGNYFTGGEYLDYRADEPFLRRNFARRLEVVRRFCPKGRLLEIGSAYGFFLDLARSSFEPLGFEVNAEAARHARDRLGLDVRAENFLASVPPDPKRLFDVVAMWDVIEHLDRPDLFLARAAEWTRSGGWLFITTGDIGSLTARLRGRKWRLIHPPTHLHYFDRTTIRRLLANHGFEVEEIRSVGVTRGLRQVLYSILVLGIGMNRNCRAISKIISPQWGITLNMFDIMQVIARRKP